MIFGYSQFGRSVAERLVEQKEISVVAFADNAKEKVGLDFKNIPVMTATEICKKYPNTLVIISSQNGFVQIKSQLIALGVDNNKIIRYIHKDTTYYERLDEKYIE